MFVKISKPSPALIAAAIAVIISSVILAGSFTNNYVLFGSNSKPTSSVIGTAEASQIPLDVKDSFKSIQKTDDGKTNPSKIKIDSDFVDPDEHCEFCYRVEYTPGAIGKGGALFKAEKAIDLTQAKRMSFFAKGALGGEQIQVSSAGKLASNGKAVKFGATSKDLALENKWKKYEIDVSNLDLSGITHGFAFKVSKNAALKNDNSSDNKNVPIVIYLKGITYEALDAKAPLPVLADSLIENQ